MEISQTSPGRRLEVRASPDAAGCKLHTSSQCQHQNDDECSMMNTKWTTTKELSTANQTTSPSSQLETGVPQCCKAACKLKLQSTAIAQCCKLYCKIQIMMLVLNDDPETILPWKAALKQQSPETAIFFIPTEVCLMYIFLLMYFRAKFLVPASPSGNGQFQEGSAVTVIKYCSSSWSASSSRQTTPAVLASDYQVKAFQSLATCLSRHPDTI